MVKESLFSALARHGIRQAVVAVACSLVLCGVSTPALAQEEEQPPAVISPLRVEPDINGVNLVNGKYEVPLPSLSVPAAPRLRFDRIQNAAPYVYGRISRNLESGDEKSANFSVHLGASSSESFRCIGIECSSVTGSGSTLTQSGMYYRQTGSGAYYSFTRIHSYAQDYEFITKQMYLSNIAYPDGEVISYTYSTATLPSDNTGRIFYRPTRISTNRGYFITIQYAGHVLGEIGWGNPSEVALYSDADPVTPLGRLSYGGNGTITDLAGRVFQMTGARNELGFDIETMASVTTLPEETSGSLTVSQHASYTMVGSVMRDGVQWSYGYTNPVHYSSIAGYRYDKINVTGPNGYNITYDVEEGANRRNVIKKRTDELNRSTTFQHDPYYRVTKIIYPEGNSVGIEYDEWGNISRKTSKAKVVGPSDLVEQAYVDGATCQGVNCYRATWTRDALNRQTDYVYNAYGQLTEQLDPADAAGVRRKTIIEYESHDTGAGVISRKKTVRICGATTTCGTNAEIRTEYEYWGHTNLPTVVREVDQATGQTRQTQMGYDAAGRVLSVDGPLPGTDDTQYFRYDVLGRKTWEIEARAPNGLRLAKRFTYRAADDKESSVETGTLPDHTSSALTVIDRTDLTYDSRRNAIREAVSAQGQTIRVTDRSYLNRGLLDCTAIRMHLAVLPAPSSTAACSSGAQGAHGPDRISKNSYDAAGQLLKTQKALGTPLVQDYVAYTYTPNGKQEYITDANGNKARFLYDTYDRQSHWYFPNKTGGGVSATDYEQYGYDAVGNRTSLRRRDGRTLIFAYDGRNRMTSKIVPEGCAPIQVGACAPASATRDVYYTYDIMDRQLTARYDSQSGADGLTSGYDAFGNLVSSTISMGGFSKILTSQYDAAGNRTRLTHPDAQAFTYGYDALSRLSGVYEGIGTTIPLNLFSYNARGLLEGRSERWGSAVGYTYDTAGRLASQADSFVGGVGNVTFSSISYNAASQMVGRTRSNDAYAWRDAIAVSRNYAANGLNQYTGAGPVSFTYDASGNLTSDGANTYGYDGENRLISASNGTSLSYDPAGRLWQVTKGAASTRFLYDGDALVGEFDGAGLLTARYVHGSNAAADDPLVWYEKVGGAWRTRWLHSDHQGSIVAVTDGAGASPSLNTYDEYGVPGGITLNGIPGSTNTGRFQYTGQAWVAELGLYHYKARIYSPTLGRFLQTDPIGYDDQINLYAYVANDPVNGTDPTGTTCSDPRGGQCPNAAATAATAATTVAAREGIGAERARSQYKESTSRLAPNDSAGRSAAKASARAATPPITRGVVEGVRPGLGPKPGSGGTANQTNAGADKVAGRLGTAGRVAGVAGVAVGAARVATSDNPGQEAARVGGGIAGAIAGAEGGAALGSLGGPWGAAAGGVIGGIVGGFLGEEAVNSVIDW